MAYALINEVSACLGQVKDVTFEVQSHMRDYLTYSNIIYNNATTTLTNNDAGEPRIAMVNSEDKDPNCSSALVVDVAFIDLDQEVAEQQQEEKRKVLAELQEAEKKITPVSLVDTWDTFRQTFGEDKVETAKAFCTRLDQTLKTSEDNKGLLKRAIETLGEVKELIVNDNGAVNDQITQIKFLADEIEFQDIVLKALRDTFPKDEKLTPEEARIRKKEEEELQKTTEEKNPFPNAWNANY